MSEQDKVTVDDIIGIVKTDEPTDSVALKKEAQLSICEKRLIELEKENEQLKESVYSWSKSYNRVYEENEQLKTIISQLRTDNTKQKKKLNTTMKENEQLKKEIEELKQALIHSAFDR